MVCLNKTPSADASQSQDFWEQRVKFCAPLTPPTAFLKGLCSKKKRNPPCTEYTQMALNRIWENRNKGEKTAAGSFGERAEQQEKGSRGKPVAQTQLRVIKEKMQMDAVELKAFVNHSHSLIHHHLKGSQSCGSTGQGRALTAHQSHTENPAATPVCRQNQGARLCSEPSTRGCAHRESLSARPAITANLASSKPSLQKTKLGGARNFLYVPQRLQIHVNSFQEREIPQELPAKGHNTSK